MSALKELILIIKINNNIVLLNIKNKNPFFSGYVGINGYFNAVFERDTHSTNQNWIRTLEKDDDNDT